VPYATIVSDPRELPELACAPYLAEVGLTSQFRDFQERAIVFHSDPLAHDIEVAGAMRLSLQVQSDAPDFDLWAQVLMVLPDGSTVRLGEDIRRARFRNGPFRQALLKPDQIADARVARIKVYLDRRHGSVLSLPLAARVAEQGGKPAGP